MKYIMNMKNYNKILEAVNRGIKFALDDFEDQEEIQGQVNSKVKYQGGMKEYVDLMNEVVDLGLPSGTLWCKYNLGVDLNQLTKPEDWYGKYYAWGELQGNKTDKDGKIYFNWNNYKFGNAKNKLTKYCSDSQFGLNGFTDTLTELLLEDDIAYQNKHLYNYKFHIPTEKQCEELIKYTSNYWVNNYNPNKTMHNPENDNGIQGLNGRVFEGKNGNQIFIPAAGYCHNSHANDDVDYCYLWSSDLYLLKTCYATYVSFNSADINICCYDRYCGFTVRPVINL